ncbi:diguanylate cyclase domain-containing protein [Salinisphaera hydrothermalis]|uniref:diguanylate cyclase domain-containing protein n=1 Tax=Salinisphaera hydrothermalis TaxID=563188 RepID=UPI000562227B
MLDQPAIPDIDFLDLLLDAICIVDAQDRFVWISPAGERIFGYTPAEMIGRRVCEFVLPGDEARTREHIERIKAGEDQTNFENRYRRKDGGIVHLMWSARWSEADQVRVAVAHDVTRLREAKSVQSALYSISEAAHTAEDLDDLFSRIHAIISHLLPAANFCVALLDARAQLIEYPYCADERGGAPRTTTIDADTLGARVIRTGTHLLLAPENFDEWPASIRQLKDSGTRYWLGAPLKLDDRTIGALIVKSYEGGLTYTESDLELLEFVSTQVAQAIERKRLYLRLRHMAHHDSLTGLANRRQLEARMASAFAAADGRDIRVALLYLDLDGFKDINDTYSHEIGDALLQAVAHRLNDTLRESSTVARLGGDEFAVLVDELATSGDAYAVVNRIQDMFATPFTIAGHALRVTPSIGVAVYPDDADTAETLLQHADRAMYDVKRYSRPASASR